MYNTQQGHLPGHRRKSQEDAEPKFGSDGLLFRSNDFLANRNNAGEYDFKNQ